MEDNGNGSGGSEAHTKGAARNGWPVKDDNGDMQGELEVTEWQLTAEGIEKEGLTKGKKRRGRPKKEDKNNLADAKSAEKMDKFLIKENELAFGVSLKDAAFGKSNKLDRTPNGSPTRSRSHEGSNEDKKVSETYLADEEDERDEDGDGSVQRT